MRYCAPELLDLKWGIRVEKRKSTNESDVYSLSMVIVEVRVFSESMTRPGSDCFRFQLMTGKVPFPETPENSIVILLFQNKRPPKPRHFEAPGMTPAVWEIAQKCWHQNVSADLN